MTDPHTLPPLSFAPLEGITTRQMMGEYIIYYQGKIAAEP